MDRGNIRMNFHSGISIRDRDHGSFGDLLVPVESTLNVPQFNAVSTALYHAVATADVDESVGGVLFHNVTGVIPTLSVPFEEGGVVSCLSPIAFEHRGT